MNLATVLQAPQPPKKNPDPIVYSQQTLDATLKLIRAAKKKTIFIYVCMKFARSGNPNVPEKGSAHIEVTKKAAIRFLNQLSRNSEWRTEALINIGTCHDILFIG